MPPQLDRPPPPYLQIVEHYRDRIRDGRLGDGDRLPSTRQLAQEWRVAHATAAKGRPSSAAPSASGLAGACTVVCRNSAIRPGSPLFVSVLLGAV